MSHDVSHEPGADELRIRSILKTRGVGPDATPPLMLPKPAGRPRDWLDDILDSTPPEPEPDEEEPPADQAPDDDPKPAPPKRPAPRNHPQQSLLDASAAIPPRLRWLAYHATAAAAGWRIGLVDWSTHTAAWYAQGHWTTPTAFVLYGLSACTVALYRRTRTWASPAAWAAAIPASSIVTGLLLYGTGA